MLNPTPSTNGRTVEYRARMERRRIGLINRIAHIPAFPQGITLEIGSGHGHFLVAYAQANMDRSCIGVDIVSERVARAIRKRDRAKLPNLQFIHADARLFLEVLPADRPLSEIFLLFPDPWPKQRHHKHRIIQPSFLTALADRAGKGARLFFRTDFRPYFDDAMATLRQHSRWELREEAWPFEYETVFQQRAPDYQSMIASVREP